MDSKLELAIKDIEKNFGKGSIMKLGDKKSFDGNIIPSGNCMVDKALGIGGYPKGRSIEIYGMESSGKTTLALHAVAECQKQGGRVAYIDVEHAVDIDYARALGINVDDVIFSQPDYGEQALDILIALVESGSIDLAVVDSVAMLTPKCEIEGSMEDNSVGAQARMLGKVSRKIAAVASKNNVCIIWINQIRYKVGVMYGNPETRPAGKALDFLTSMMIKIGKLKTEEDCNRTKIKVVKNKCAPPFKEAEFDIVFGKGMADGILEAAIEADIIHKGGAWYSYKEKKWQGKDALSIFMSENPEIYNEIKTQLRGNLV